MSAFRDFVTQMQSCAVDADEPISTQESTSMQFDRERLEAVVEYAEAIAAAGSSILEVLPDGCVCNADVDYRFPAMAQLSFTADSRRFPALPIGSEVIALSVAIDDLDNALAEIGAA